MTRRTNADRGIGAAGTASGAGGAHAAGEPPEVTLEYAGRTIAAREGQTVAAALMADGINSWRTTRGACRPRGLFCGIGVCYDCLVEIDGFADQRACLVEVADGMRIGPDTPEGGGDGTDAREEDR